MTPITYSDVNINKKRITLNPLVDNLLALKILTLLIQPFTDYEAYKLGIIDADGNVLRSYTTLTKAKEKAATNYLYRMTINLKKLINKLPNNEWYMRHLATSLFLIKESYNEGNDEETNFEDKFFAIMASEKLLEEELKVMEFIGNQNDPK
jgi:hypothetical protein